MTDTIPTATDAELREITQLTIAAINSGILNKNNPPVISPQLAARIVELQECGLDIKVVAATPDSAVVLVLNAEPEPTLMRVSLDTLSNTLN